MYNGHILQTKLNYIRGTKRGVIYVKQDIVV